MRVARYALLALPFAWLAGCASDEANVFDPASDFDPPVLASFSVETQTDGSVVASWSANEAVRAVVEWNDGTAELPAHSYSTSREYREEGSQRLIGVASDTEYSYSVRMTDRAGNVATQFFEDQPTFTTGSVSSDPTFLFVMIDVGWGDALYLESPDGKKVLIDAGHPIDAQIVTNFLRSHGATQLHAASTSHSHADHMGGYFGDDFADVPGVFQGGARTQYFLDHVNRTVVTNQFEDDLMPVVRSAANEIVLLEEGARTGDGEWLNWGEGVEVELLAAGEKPFVYPDLIQDQELGSVINNDSMVWRVQYGSFSMLLTGDGEFATEQYLMDRYPASRLRATVHKLGHHGANDANGDRFLSTTSPIIALVTNSVRENPGVMHPFVLGRVRQKGADYFASDRVIPNRDRALPGVRGDLYIRTDGTDFTVSADRVRFE